MSVEEVVASDRICGQPITRAMLLADLAALNSLLSHADLPTVARPILESRAAELRFWAMGPIYDLQPADGWSD